MKVIYTLITLLCLLISSHTLAEKNDKESPEAQAAPHIPLPLLENGAAGRTSGINDHKGKIIYLDFWASWCGPCRQSFPFLQNLRDQYHDQGFEIVAVNVDVELKDALSFLQNYPVDYPILLDPEGIMATTYGVQGLPTSFIIDRDGNVVYAHLGFKEKDKQWITALIKQNLEEQPPEGEAQ